MPRPQIVGLQPDTESLAPTLLGALAPMRSKLAAACRNLRSRRNPSTPGVESGSIETPYPRLKTPDEGNGWRAITFGAGAPRGSQDHHPHAARRVSESPIGGAAAGLGTGTSVSSRFLCLSCDDFCALPKLTRSASFNHLITHITLFRNYPHALPSRRYLHARTPHPPYMPARHRLARLTVGAGNHPRQTNYVPEFHFSPRETSAPTSTRGWTGARF